MIEAPQNGLEPLIFGYIIVYYNHQCRWCYHRDSRILVYHIRKEELWARWLQFVICANLGGVIRCHYLQITFLQFLAYGILQSYRWFTNIRDGEVCYSLLILCAGIVLIYVSAGVIMMIREFLAGVMMNDESLCL